ncbi:hypothetical protein GLYMA_01G139666v4 [Glycine max]|nr:hypothetical protein GLYMA_01G139666v4 [Glycine max]KAH1163016.1 hypothetical protein GYH30_001515 [Glycine max]
MRRMLACQSKTSLAPCQSNNNHWINYFLNQRPRYFHFFLFFLLFSTLSLGDSVPISPSCDHTPTHQQQNTSPLPPRSNNGNTIKTTTAVTSKEANLGDNNSNSETTARTLPSKPTAATHLQSPQWQRRW